MERIAYWKTPGNKDLIAINGVSGFLDSVGHKTDAVKSFILEYLFLSEMQVCKIAYDREADDLALGESDNS